MGNGCEMTLTCRQCDKQFIFSESEREFYKQKGFTTPSHCKECRSSRRSQLSIVCSKCGNKPNNGSGVYCPVCIENERIAFGQEIKRFKTSLDETSAKLHATESEITLVTETMNTKLTTLESEKAQLIAEYDTKISVFESEKTKLLQEAEAKLNSNESEKTQISSLLEQEKKVTADLHQKLNSAVVELEKALKYRATLDSLEPCLNDIKEGLLALGRSQNSINQTVLEWIRRSDETSRNSSLFGRIFRFKQKPPKVN